MKRKKSPPSEFIMRSLVDVGGETEKEVQRNLQAVLNTVRYAGDVKQIAESYGLHYLKSKRMRVRELRQWILNNHPAIHQVGE
jgi:predicted component of type VI protein secretion system